MAKTLTAHVNIGGVDQTDLAHQGYRYTWRCNGSILRYDPTGGTNVIVQSGGALAENITSLRFVVAGPEDVANIKDFTVEVSNIPD